MRHVVTLIGFLEALVALSAIPIYCFLFFILSKTRLVHTAFRTTTRIFSVAVTSYMLLSITLVVFCALNSNVSREYHAPRLDPLYILIYEMHQSASFSFWLAISFITIERAIASHFVSSYEDKFNSTMAQTVIISVFIVVDFVENLCRVLFPFQTILFVCFLNTFINLGVMYYIKRINTRRNSLEKDLSYRFQVKEIVLTSSAILPLNYIITIFSCALIPFMYMIDHGKNRETREFSTSCFYLLSAIFPLTYAIGLIRCAAIRKIMISQGFTIENRIIISQHDQYEQARNAQNEIWQVVKS